MMDGDIGKRIAKIDPVLVREISGFLVHCSDCDKMKSCPKYNHIFNNRKMLKGIGLRCTSFEDADDHAQAPLAKAAVPELVATKRTPRLHQIN